MKSATTAESGRGIVSGSEGKYSVELFREGERCYRIWACAAPAVASCDAIKMAIDRMVAQGQISEESKQRIRESGDYLPEPGAVDASSDAESEEPSIDASSPLGDIVAALIRNIGSWPCWHPCHRIKA
jgi:hypothetical protein